MRVLISLFTFIFVLGCPTEEDAQIPVDNELGSRPCTTYADCAVGEECALGICSPFGGDGTADGQGTSSDAGAADGQGDGNIDGQTESQDAGTADGQSDGQTESVDAGSSDGLGTGSGNGSTDGQTEPVDAGASDGGGSPNSENLSLTATAEASEEWSDVWSAEKAIDGSMITYWSTADDVVSATFTVTLSEEAIINKVIINSGDYPIKSFDLQISTDGVSYASIGQYETPENADKTIDFASSAARHVRLENITAEPPSAGWHVAAIYEIEIYAAE